VLEYCNDFKQNISQMISIGAYLLRQVNSHFAQHKCLWIKGLQIVGLPNKHLFCMGFPLGITNT